MLIYFYKFINIDFSKQFDQEKKSDCDVTQLLKFMYPLISFRNLENVHYSKFCCKMESMLIITTIIITAVTIITV